MPSTASDASERFPIESFVKSLGSTTLFSDSLNNSSTTNDLKPILKSENSDPNQNGGIPNASDNNSHKTTFIQEDHREHKKVTKKDSEKRVVLPRDLTKLSIGNLTFRLISLSLLISRNMLRCKSYL
jgi:hypothetical protein